MPTGRVQQITRINSDPSYHGWPTVARRSSGELLVVSSAGREAHICPYGQVHLIRSTDGGLTWSTPQILADGPIDDRDAGVLETSRGTILVNWFTSLAWRTQIDRARRGEINWLPEETQRRWQPRYDALDDEICAREMGHWIVRSTDGGKSWSQRIASVANSPHGPVELSDGRLFYPGLRRSTSGQWQRGNPHEGRPLGAAVSEDDGLTWEWSTTIDPAPGQQWAHYHEPHAVEAADGTIVLQIRTNAPDCPGQTLQTESSDGGQTWTQVHPIGVWGQPSHLLRLRDGRLLMTYGYRREPFGNQARISADCGRSWSEPIAISDDGDRGDLGYPSSVQLDDGTIVTVWYEANEEFPMAILRQARWTIED